MTPVPFAAGFPAATEEDWRQAALKALKGAPLSALRGMTDDGIAIEPLYPRARGRTVLGAPAGRRWRIAARVDHPVPDEASALALADLAGGADALVLVSAGSRSARGYGVAPGEGRALDAALAGVELDLIQTRLDPASGTRAEAVAFAGLVKRRGLPASAVHVDFGIDPLGSAAAGGREPPASSGLPREAAETVAALRDAGFEGPVLRADGRPYHEAGATEAQELAFVLATLVAYRRALDEAGTPAAEARTAVSAVLAADADQFLTVAKFRALRRLWARVEEACGLDPEPLRLHGETAWRMMTVRDPHVNILRATAAAFAAVLGGADGITVLPFTLARGLPDAAARRLARNTQLILMEEAHLWRVADPAAGAGGFEALTDALCLKAWEIFGTIERNGGMVAAIAGGEVAATLGKARARLRDAVATGRRPLTGTSAFPDLAEEGAAVPGGARTAPFLPEGGTLPPLPSMRLAEPFEALRDRADRARERQGRRPGVFLADLAGTDDAAAEAAYAADVFAAGGIEAARAPPAPPVPPGPPDMDALVRAFRGSGARIACLCVGGGRAEPDEDAGGETAAERAEQAAKALRRAGGVRFLAAVGHPGDREGRLRRAGVDAFLFPGCDLVAALAQCHDALAAPEDAA